LINNKYEIKYILIQVILTLFIAFIPIYFYLDASFENQSIKDKMEFEKLCNFYYFKNRKFRKRK